MRLGLHRMSPDADSAFRAYVDAVRPPIVKFLDPGSGDEPLAAWCVQRGVAVVGRVYFEKQYLGAEGGRQIQRVVAAAHACPSIHWWELHNESWHVPGEMSRYAGLSIEFMDAMRAIGRGAVIGCFSEGTPQVDGSDSDEAWRQYLPALAHAIRDDHALGLHEYSAPIVQFAVGNDGLGWHTLRYRRSREVWRKLGLAGWDKLRIFITEYGLDDIQDAKRPGPSGKGWRDYDGTEWSRPPLSPAGDFAGQTAWYCRELGKDPQVGGVVDFGFSARDKDSWRSFDMADTPAMLDRMQDEMLQLPRDSTSSGGGMNEQVAAAIRSAGDAAQVLRLNRTAAIQRQATRDGYLIVGNETTVIDGTTRYAVQKAEHPTTGAARYYYCIAPDWSRVFYLGKV